MKKVYLLLSGLLMGLSLHSAIAQTALVAADSTQARNVALLIASDTNRAIGYPKPSIGDLVSSRIPVKAGDSITVSAMVLDNTNYKSRFWKNLAKAVVPSLILSNLSAEKAAVAAEQPLNKATITTFGASLAIIPGVIELAQSQLNSKTFVGLAVYDTDSQRVATVTDLMTKAARKDWEELQVGYRVEKDGFVDVIGNRNALQNLSFELYGENNWVKVSKYSKIKQPPAKQVDLLKRSGQSPQAYSLGGPNKSKSIL